MATTRTSIDNSIALFVPRRGHLALQDTKGARLSTQHSQTPQQQHYSSKKRNSDVAYFAGKALTKVH